MPIALAQVKAGTNLKTYKIKFVKSNFLCIDQKGLLKQYITI